jgi:hypothetical protein
MSLIVLITTAECYFYIFAFVIQFIFILKMRNFYLLYNEIIFYNIILT